MALTPTITSVGPLLQGSSVQAIGTGFGRVSSAALVDGNGFQYECEFIVDRGDSLHFTVPVTLPAGSYTLVLGDLDNIPSVNQVGATVCPSDFPVVPTPPTPPVVMPDSTSPAAEQIRAMTRLELGDRIESFQSSIQGDGRVNRLDLPVTVVDPSTLVVRTKQINGALANLRPGVDYQLDAVQGVITLNETPSPEVRITVAGLHAQFFTDDELNLYINNAALLHSHNAETATIYRDSDQFKHYAYAQQTLDTLAPVEYQLVGMLASILALEVILTDASFDIDVHTADGTNLPRTQRFHNLQQLIELKTQTYERRCNLLGVGLSRIEVFTVRRVSRTTGRLVPIYVDREYDDVITPPIRVYTPRNTDQTGSAFIEADPYAYGGTGIGGYP